MAYRESDDDRAIRRKFQNDNNRMLRGIKLWEGSLRGLTLFDLRFDFPVTAIAGRNGSGKSTLLAMACCAFHGKEDGFKLARRNIPYYRFSDFFMQRAEETDATAISIHYFISHDNWRKGPGFEEGKGIGAQLRQKKKGGKWNDYDRRLQRTVVFIGIDRVVPHIERSQSRSYRLNFSPAPPQGWEDRVRAAVSKVLDKPYVQYKQLRHQKYSLPIVHVGDTVYSGFNMGAGENALFEIFSTIYSCGQSALIVIDEIELGLHVLAQRRLMEELKKACLQTNCQVICTTHSKEIFECLPDDGRVFIESKGGKTHITTGISPLYAFAKMGARDAHELDVLVEDEVARCIITNILSADMRGRLSIHVIGSAGALSRQLAAGFARKGKSRILAVYDGEQRNLAAANVEYARNQAERKKQDFDPWFDEHSAYLPGETWPEGWLVQKAREHSATLAPVLGTDVDTLMEALDAAQRAGKHNEFYTLAQMMGYEDKFICLQTVTTHVCGHCAPDFLDILLAISRLLAE